MGTDEKKKIYYARTYRHLQLHHGEFILFFLLAVFPALLALCLFYDELTRLMSEAAAWVLTRSGAGAYSLCTGSFLPRLGPVYYLDLPTALPDRGFVLWNLGISLALLFLLAAGPMGGRPMGIYFIIQLSVHTIACLFFLFRKAAFPYTLATYAELYMKQEVCIFLTFLILIGLVLGLLERGGLISRVLTMLCLMLYAFAFGLVRYTLFLLVMQKFTVLYMPICFFALGPFFDFLYFVAFYAICTNHLIKTYDGRHREVWAWA